MRYLREAFDFGTLIVILAGVAVMVRPGSNGKSLVDALGATFYNALAMGLGETPKSGG